MSFRRALHETGITRSVREAHLALLRVEGRVQHRRRARPAGTPLRILAHTPGYPPAARGGAEITLHGVARALQHRGHEVRVLVDEERGSRTLDGIEVLGNDSRSRRHDLYGWCDVAVAHLRSRHRAIRLAARHRRPFVFYVQIGGTPRNATFGTPALTVFSSEVVRAQYPWVEHTLVLHPPIDAAEYRTTPGDAVTLVNLNAIKGAATFFALAERLPERRFLGVRGWGTQEIPHPVPANVDIVGPVDDMREVYGRTRVLLVPSVYEAYGRVALEAAASGIPTLAHPSVGVQEAMGDAAIYVDREDADGWASAIVRLDDPSAYAERSSAARNRFDALDPDAELDAFAAALDRVSGSG